MQSYAAPHSRRRATSERETPPAADPLYTAAPKQIWRYLKTQPASFWFINAYLFFEYVRPQSVYSWLDGPPWAQVLILLALGTHILEGKSFQLRTPADWSLCFFSLVVFVSSVQAYRPEVSFATLSVYYSWVLIYLLIANIVTTERRFFVFVLAFLLYSFKMSQHATRSWAMAGFAFRDWGVTGGPGWFHNSGEFGIQMTMYVPLATYFIVGLIRHWGPKTRLLFYTMPLTAVIGAIGSSSRGAMLGVAVVAIFMVARTRHKAKGATFLVVLGLLAYLLIPEESLDRFRTMGEDSTSVSRKVYWTIGWDIMAKFPVLGIGYDNWIPYTRSIGLHVALPHNIFIEAGAELGYTGLLALILMIVSSYLVNARTRRMLSPLGERGRFMTEASRGLDAALVGYMVSGFFVTVLYYPYLWINLAMTVALHNAARHTTSKTRTNVVRSDPPPRTPVTSLR